MFFDEKKVSLLGFGAMRMPETDGKADMAHIKKMVSYAMDNGVNYFDTAYVYHNGMSEKILKEALVDVYSRDKFFLATKLPVWRVSETKDMYDIFNEQLEKCGVKYFDFYLLHAMGKTSEEKAVKIGLYNFMRELKEKGLVKHIGFSFHDTAKCLDEILTNHPEMEFVQLQINYKDWDEINAKALYETAIKHKKPIIIMEPVKGGTLAKIPEHLEAIFKNYSDASPASWAIRYCASLDGVLTVLSGMSNIEQVMDNVSFMSEFKRLNNEELSIIAKVTEELYKYSEIPCTDCKYCVDDCPQKIAMPNIFAIFNEYKKTDNFEKAKEDYRKIDKEARANKCIACANCESHCPQKIEIIKNLDFVHFAIK